MCTIIRSVLQWPPCTMMIVVSWSWQRSAAFETLPGARERREFADGVCPVPAALHSLGDLPAPLGGLQLSHVKQRRNMQIRLQKKKDDYSRRAIYYFFSRQVLFFFGILVLCFPVSLIFCFSAFLLFLLLCFSASLLFAFPASLHFCFSAFCFPCFSVFPAFLLFAFPASLLFCFSVSLASLLLYFCAFLLLLFYFFFSSVMCFCCSTSCSFASLLPVFTVSLFFIFFCFILFCLYPKWNSRDTPGETQRNPKEILIRNPTWKPKWTIKKP